MLTAHQLVAGHHGKPVQGPLSFTVGPGQLLGITGPSGVGKSTVLRTLAGLVAPLAGKPIVDGTIGLLPQHPRRSTNPRWTLQTIISEPARIDRRTPDVADVAGRVGLDLNLLGRYPSQVSDGQLQRACLARLLVHDPAIILCDEPTAMLDPIAAADTLAVLDSLRSADRTVVLSSHNHRAIAARATEILALQPRCEGRGCRSRETCCG